MEAHPHFETALAALDAGDLESLRELLALHPNLATARVVTVEPPYEGYFAGATLLHHLAGNPFRAPIPSNAVELAAALLDAGAEVDAPCGGGPSQPASGGGTLLGLVASSRQAQVQGLAEPLIDLLLERGAQLDAGGTGGVLWTAVYHVVENRGQREVAELLVSRGHPTDFVFSAALGRLDLLEQLWSEGGLAPRADHLFRHHRPGDDEATEAEILGDALLAASAHGHTECQQWLLDRGAPVNGWRHWGPFRITPLHAAAWAGWPDAITLLHEQGADPLLRDSKFHATPLGWAAHCHRQAALERMMRDDAFLDLGDALELDRRERFEQLLGDGDPNQPVADEKPGALLRTAAFHGRRWAVDLLLERGADPALRGRSGKNAEEWATERGHAEIADRLRAHLAPG